MIDVIEKYKNSLIKLWNQSCENSSTKLLESFNEIDIRKDIVNINSKDKYLFDFVNKTFNGGLKDMEWSNHRFNNNCDYFKIGKKHLSISKLMIMITADDKINATKDEKSYFSSEIKTVSYLKNLKTLAAPELNKVLLSNSGNIIHLIQSYYAGSHSQIRLNIGIALLSYGNINVPITLEEYDNLRNYELDCRKKDVMEDVYRNLTLLTPNEYKEFITWKESKEISKEENILNLIEKAE